MDAPARRPPTSVSELRNRRLDAARTEVDRRVRGLGDRARAQHADPSLHIRFVEPWSLRPGGKP